MTEQEEFISFVGKKGMGMSTATMALCEDVAKEVAQLRGRGESPKKFYNPNRVESISARDAWLLLRKSQ